MRSPKTTRYAPRRGVHPSADAYPHAASRPARGLPSLLMDRGPVAQLDRATDSFPRPSTAEAPSAALPVERLRRSAATRLAPRDPRGVGIGTGWIAGVPLRPADRLSLSPVHRTTPHALRSHERATLHQARASRYTHFNSHRTNPGRDSGFMAAAGTATDGRCASLHSESNHLYRGDPETSARRQPATQQIGRRAMSWAATGARPAVPIVKARA